MNSFLCGPINICVFFQRIPTDTEHFGDCHHLNRSHIKLNQRYYQAEYVNGWINKNEKFIRFYVLISFFLVFFGTKNRFLLLRINTMYEIAEYYNKRMNFEKQLIFFRFSQWTSYSHFHDLGFCRLKGSNFS